MVVQYNQLLDESIQTEKKLAEDCKAWNLMLDQVRSQAEISNTASRLRRDLEIADDRLCWAQREPERERRRVAMPERRRVVIIEC